jgi:hypothetical protein
VTAQWLTQVVPASEPLCLYTLAMTADASGRPAPEDEAELTRTYVLVLVVEVIVIFALYWFGMVFS